MELFDVIFEEIRFSKKNFIWATLLFAVITGSTLFIIISIEGYNYYSHLQMSNKENDTSEKMNMMLMDYKKIATKLKHTIHVLPKNVITEGFYTEGFSHQKIPYNYTLRLLNNIKSEVSAIVPIYRQKKFWSENSRSYMEASVALNGFVHENKNNYYGYCYVNAGNVALGYEMHNSINLKTGDSINLNGQTYIISDCLEQQGTIDDITIWLNFEELNFENNEDPFINEIWIWDNSFSIKTYNELVLKIKNLLLECDVKSKLSPALLKINALNIATATSGKNINAENSFFKLEKYASSKFFHILISIAVCCTIIISCITILNNSLKRKSEIALLLSIGFNRTQVFKIFIYRTVMVILIGVVFGVASGITISTLMMFLFWNIIYVDMLLVLKVSFLIVSSGLLISSVSVYLVTVFEPGFMLIAD